MVVCPVYLQTFQWWTSYLPMVYPTPQPKKTEGRHQCTPQLYKYKEYGQWMGFHEDLHSGLVVLLRQEKQEFIPFV